MAHSHELISVILLHYIFQVSRAAVEEYTGEGELPSIVMILRAVSDKTTPPDLSLPVTLTGVDHSSILLERKGELPLAGYEFTSQGETTGHYCLDQK